MRKVSIFLVISVFTVILCGCSIDNLLGNNSQKPYISESLEESNEFIMETEFEEYTEDADRVAILFEKNDGNDFAFYEPYDMYKLVNNEWVLVPFKSNHEFHKREYLVRKKSNTEEPKAKGFQYVVFEDFNNEITTGKYKIVKEFENKKVSCEFSIK